MVYVFGKEFGEIFRKEPDFLEEISQGPLYHRSQAE